MKEIIIGTADAGRRLDRYLFRLLAGASSGFIYKMLRKKNITLNRKKADGKELLADGDVIRIYFSDETFAKFSANGSAAQGALAAEKNKDRPAGEALQILYEDEDMLFVNKPAGLLSQKAAPSDVSVCELLTEHVGAGLTKPSVCNRLDRNTSGIVSCGISYRGLKTLSALFRERQVHKQYVCIVFGQIHRPDVLEGYLVKDQARNTVRVDAYQMPGSKKIVTSYIPLAAGTAPGGVQVTYVQVSPLTGRTHQIRAHLAWAGHPLVGDVKYASPEQSAWSLKQMHLQNHLLHCARMTFPDEVPALPQLSGMDIMAPLPDAFARVKRMIKWDTVAESLKDG